MGSADAVATGDPAVIARIALEGVEADEVEISADEVSLSTAFGTCGASRDPVWAHCSCPWRNEARQMTSAPLRKVFS